MQIEIAEGQAFPRKRRSAEAAVSDADELFGIPKLDVSAVDPVKVPALLDRPLAEKARPLPGRFERVDKTRRTDLLQLAHYWRMLEACGHAPATDGVVWGGIIGTEGVVVWTDLTERRFLASGWTPVDRAPRGRLSALELYDIEFAFRLDIAATAQAHVIDPAVSLLVEPTKTGEYRTAASYL